MTLCTRSDFERLGALAGTGLAKVFETDAGQVTVSVRLPLWTLLFPAKRRRIQDVLQSKIEEESYLGVTVTLKTRFL